MSTRNIEAILQEIFAELVVANYILSATLLADDRLAQHHKNEIIKTIEEIRKEGGSG
jgi:hypothetical protein